MDRAATASPQRVKLGTENFGLSDPKVYSPLVKKLKMLEPLEVIDLPNIKISLYQSGDSYNGVDETGRLVYQMKFKRTTIQGFKALYQCQVYNNRTVYFRFKGYFTLAHYVFFEYFLKESKGCVVSDRQQTDRGESFWMRTLAEAMAAGFNVYYRDDVLKKTYKFTSESQIEKAAKRVWGDEQKFEAIRLVITKEVLPKAIPISG